MFSVRDVLQGCHTIQSLLQEEDYITAMGILTEVRTCRHTVDYACVLLCGQVLTSPTTPCAFVAATHLYYILYTSVLDYVCKVRLATCPPVVPL